MSKNKIIIKGARENNLKNIDLEIPRDAMVVFTGVSGSGKSSLAFETLYAEGQRRYMESLSSYARQFLGQMEKPDVDSIEGLSPAISIDQKSTNQNPRSTVGTVTEIYDYLRLLYARVGVPHCPKCGKEIVRQTVDQIVDKILELEEGSRIQLLAPVVRDRKGEHQKVLEDAKREGYARVRVNGTVMELDEPIKLEKNKRHNIEVVVDRIVVKKGIEARLSQSVETVMALTDGLLLVDVGGEKDLSFSQNFACPDHGISLASIEPRMFSFNNPQGACGECAGLGFKMEFDPELIVPNPDISIQAGAIVAPGYNQAGNAGTWGGNFILHLAKHYNFSLLVPFKKIPIETRRIILYGGDEAFPIEYTDTRGNPRIFMHQWEGLVNNLARRYKETTSDYARQSYEAFITNIECPACHGKRLREEILAVTVGGVNITDITTMPVGELTQFFRELTLTPQQAQIAELILKEIKARAGFLVDVGLDYLTLARAAATLSGGEAQRIRLATQIGSGLVGVVYILDEPSIGLHQRDNDKLLKTLKHLRDLGNTLIVVEHDEDTMREADHIVDIGPGAGCHGGEVVYSGTIDGILNDENSVTGAYMSGRMAIEVPKERRQVTEKQLRIIGAQENNLKNIDVDIPLGLFVAITGVSGSGKSSLINQVLYKRLARDLNRAKGKPGKHEDLTGQEHLDKIINIDQSPIGRTPRSNPATYTGLFDLVRDIFANVPEAKVRGYQKGRFSFNVKGGRCEACSGDGIIKIEMHFLPDIFVPCEVCHGKRYNRETLEVKYKGATIADVLDMTVEQAHSFFENLPRLRDKVQTLMDVGLGYVKLGQSSTTLSGGEAQRVKLATELSKRSTGRTIYVLDEPTTGLHMADVHKLVDILQQLAEGGNSVIVIEHNLDVIKTADHIIDMGPEGGGGGGMVIAQGTPEQVAATEISYTGKYLGRILGEAPVHEPQKPEIPLDKLQTTELGSERVRKNLDLGGVDVVQWCREQIATATNIEKKGKNWYVTGDGCVITINAGSHTIITAHKAK
ncbi:MAG: excinuclease ABC subunit UvrA [Defluviitaleaceae bacterium]|nr:excinuclease ABC subunit UvrA [Defluviitaleaceae bacterium]